LTGCAPDPPFWAVGRGTGTVKHKAYLAVFPMIRHRKTELIILIFMLTLNIHVKETIHLTDDQEPFQGWALLTGCAPESAFWAVGVARAAVETVRRPQLELADLNTIPCCKLSIKLITHRGTN
jgi:hypothetical protein